jgi:hypothetical protein
MVSASLAAALVSGMIDAMFSGNFIMPHSQMLLFLLAGWILGNWQATTFQGIQQPTVGRVTRTTIIASVLAAVVVTTILALEYLPVVRELPFQIYKRSPHFWQFGRFDGW